MSEETRQAVHASILVVEDEVPLREALVYTLRRQGYRVESVGDGPGALDAFRRGGFDLVILDLLLPGLDGLDVCRIIRQESLVPILILTARSEEEDRVRGLELGADDYVTKPFSMRELLARIKALLRRASIATEPGRLTAGALEVDLARREAYLRGRPLNLSRREFDLLAFLIRNRGRAVTREQILNQVWGYEYVGDTRTVDVHIRWLRRKIEDRPASPHRIITIRGIGYRFEA